jgi:hypothetical protein
MSKEKMNRELGIKHKALKKRTEDESRMKKVHSSTEYCAKCGKKVSKTERHESGHREFDHVDTPGYHGEGSARIVR